jgi:tRNA (guanine-N7-)-methyltransferase
MEPSLASVGEPAAAVEKTTLALGEVSVRKRRRGDKLAGAPSTLSDGEGEPEPEEVDEEEMGPARPQKKDFRSRAHSNVLNANDFWFPTGPAHVPAAEYFPGLAAAGGRPRIEFVDIGCGYGSLMIGERGLGTIFPDTPMLGIEIRPKLVEFIQRKVIAMRHEARGRAGGGAGGSSSAPDAADADADAAAPAARAPSWENVWAVHNNAMRFMPNFFAKGQLSKLFFCFADPHFKKKNHRKRIVSAALLHEYAYVMADGGKVYLITDVAELMLWQVEHFSASPLFERLPREELRDDPTVPALIQTDEGMKVQRNNGNMYIAVFRKRLDPLAPRGPQLPNDNVAAAAAASDAGYTPKPGGERRGMTW